MSSCSSTAVFAWAGFIIVNFAFIGIISWGTARSWVVGISFDVVYAAALLSTAFFLERKIAADADAKDEESTVSEREDKEEVNRTLGGVLTIIYLLFVFALGTFGILLSVNLFTCGDSWGSSPNKGEVWAPKESVPQEVLNEKRFHRYDYPDYFYFPSSQKTWFSSKKVQSNYANYVFSTSQGEEPAAIEDPSEIPSPSGFIQVGDDTACVVSDNTAIAIYCSSDGSDVRQATGDAIKSINQIWTFEGVLWFTTGDWNNEKLYSFNVTTMEQTLQSTRTEGTDDEDTPECSEEDDILKISLTVLFLSCIPVIIASWIIYIYRNSVASMVLSFYLGSCGAVVTIYTAIDPDVNELDTVLKWWFLVTGLMMVLTQSYFFLAKKLSPDVGTWSAFTAGLSYAVGACWVVGIFSNWESWRMWILVNIICFFPFIGLGLTLGQVFYLFLGAIGLVLDAVNASRRIGRATDDNPIIQFIFLAVFGSLIIAGGIFVNKRSKNIQKVVDAWATIHLRGGAKSDTAQNAPTLSQAKQQGETV